MFKVLTELCLCIQCQDTPAVLPVKTLLFNFQARICTNLKYNLQNQRHTETYMSLVDAIVSGPQVVRSSEAEYILGIGPGAYLRSRNRGKVIKALFHLG